MKMFLLDEGLPLRLATHLHERGHDETVVGRHYPFALADRAILRIANAEQRTDLTNDQDFGDLVFRDRLSHAGIVLFRLGFVSIDVRMASMEGVLTDYADNLNHFIVITQRNVRVHSIGAEESSGCADPEEGDPS